MASGRRVNVRKLFGCGLRQHSDQQHCEERGGLPESKKIPEDHLPINQRFLPLLFESGAFRLRFTTKSFKSPNSQNKPSWNTRTPCPMGTSAGRGWKKANPSNKTSI